MLTNTAFTTTTKPLCHGIQNDFEMEKLLEQYMEEDDTLTPFLESLSPGAGFQCLAMLLLQHLLYCQDGYDARIRYVVKKLGVLVILHEMKYDELFLNRQSYDDDDEEESCRGRSRRRPHGDNDDIQDHAQWNSTTTTPSVNDLLILATRNFESLEHSIAARILKLSAEQKQQQQQQQQSSSSSKTSRARDGFGGSVPSSSNHHSNGSNPNNAVGGISREQLVRGLKIGSVGLVAGTLFAVTGGLAAPGIAAGIAAIAGGAATASVVVSALTSTAAVTAIFGVGGGSLAAYKMQRRTQGLTEFEFQKEDEQNDNNSDNDEDDDGMDCQKSSTRFAGTSNTKSEIMPTTKVPKAELFSTICMSGWLRDLCDFRRPWGVAPRQPPLIDKVEILERFYSVYKPENVPKCGKILASWKGEEQQLWKMLRDKYGRDPDHLFPFDDGPSVQGKLTLEQQEVLDRLFVALGYTSSSNVSSNRKKSPWRFVRSRIHESFPKANNYGCGAIPRHQSAPSDAACDSLHGPLRENEQLVVATSSVFSTSSVHTTQTNPFESYKSQQQELSNNNDVKDTIPKHLSTVWDYHANYGGELYTIRWESHLLTELCDSLADLALDMVSGATTQLLKHTAFSTLLSAVAWPFALINVANMIDGTWTLAIERSDEAGKELARSLLFSQAGHRPVTLVGFSFGSRAIYSCLKELARYQEKWEDHQMNKSKAGMVGSSKKSEFERMREPASIVEDVIIMGLPNHLSLASWVACRQVVAGRLVNCYSRRDLILSLMFQYKRLSGGLRPVCGTCPVAVPGVENVEVTDIISGHQDYCLFAGDILRRVRHGQPLRSLGNVTIDLNEN